MQNRWAAGFICILSCENSEFAQGTPSSPNVSWCKAAGGIAYDMYRMTASCSSWAWLLASPAHPNKAFCAGFHQMASFLPLDTSESCSHNHTQRGISECYFFSLLVTWVWCWVTITFWWLHVGFAIWGLQSWATSSRRRHSPCRAVGQGRIYIPSEWAVKRAGGKQEGMGHVAISCREITGISKNWCACGDVPFMMKCLNLSRSFWTFCFFKPMSRSFCIFSLELIKCVTHGKFCLSLNNVILEKTNF